MADQAAEPITYQTARRPFLCLLAVTIGGSSHGLFHTRQWPPPLLYLDLPQDHPKQDFISHRGRIVNANYHSASRFRRRVTR
ncbi:MAG TPA: hypothetical protein VGX03_06385 [Candidatus Binatia bacterium]|jgi:hypothetical protein|nr:hypothetical protein [Candidatus Binatia bacterium]